MSDLIVQAEPAYTPLRDYPPWWAKFADGSVIDAAGRDRHINFRDAVLSRVGALIEFGCVFPFKTEQGQQTFEVRVNFIDRADPFIPAGAFWTSLDKQWAPPPQLEFGLGNFRPIYYRRAEMTLVSGGAVTRGGSSGDIEPPPPPRVRYVAIEMGWQANRANGSNVKSVLWVYPEYEGDNEGDIVNWRWRFREVD
jgi:hypothetical protein